MSSPFEKGAGEQLIREIGCFPHPERYRVVSVFFGGGTPSLLEGEDIGRILEAVSYTHLAVQQKQFPYLQQQQQHLPS